MPLATNVAINPLPWFLDQEKGWNLTPATARRAFAAVAEAGFTAVHAQVPPGMTVEEYRTLLADHGLRPAPGYHSAAFEDASRWDELTEAARRDAATQAALGQTEMFLAAAMTDTRVSRPAVGAGTDPAVLERVVEGLGRAAAAITAEGVRPCLHPHVGTWIETEAETRAALDAIPAGTLSFGPDSGHLYWAGIDPAGIVQDYADRVGAVHLKDVAGAARERALRLGSDYPASTTQHHVWAEPGRGDVDFDAFLAALPPSYQGWFVVEVDVPNLSTPEESTAHSARWIAEHPPLRS